MNNTLIVLAISIFIFFVVIFSIIYIAISYSKSYNHSNISNHSNTSNPSNNRELEEALKESTSIYDDYSLSPNYNLINIEYQIIGTLSSIKAEPETIILPLYGKSVKSYRWKYFTMVNNLKIDIKKERNNEAESCMKECDVLENGETIEIPVYTNTKFIVQLYDYKPPF
tara:strand:- start:7853 stop:8359 length:507 start_codon:yes stop_codon:yes gene_type:complete